MVENNDSWAVNIKNKELHLALGFGQMWDELILDGTLSVVLICNSNKLYAYRNKQTNKQSRG